MSTLYLALPNLRRCRHLPADTSSGGTSSELPSRAVAPSKFRGPSAFCRPEMPLAVGCGRPMCSSSHIQLQNPSFSGDRPLVPPAVASGPGWFPFRRMQEFLPRSASAAGAGAEFLEQFVGPEKKKKRRSVAGIDQDELVDPATLADPDSAFCEFNGVQIHHKVCHHEEEEEVLDRTLQSETLAPYADTSTAKVGLPMVLLHGFAASVFSWARVMKPLAHLIGSKVLAFDRPAFGLTSRSGFSSKGEDTTPLNPYSMAFSVLATLSFMDMLGSEKVILMGHSAGCLVAVEAYFAAPERVAAMILVAPAIVAPFIERNPKKEREGGGGLQSKDGSSTTNIRWNPLIVIWRRLSWLAALTAQATVRIIKGIRDMIGSLMRNILTALLRSTIAIILVRMLIDKFGVVAVRNAWCHPDQVPDHVIDGYTKPLKTKGWEVALLEYTLAMLTNSASNSKPPLTRRLSEISCPVLIVTGDTDRLVPSWNAKRLASVIPGSTFEVIKNCGHLPHEEKPQEFLLVVKRFLQRTFGASEEAALASNS